MRKKEKLFCVYVSNGRSFEEAALAAGFESGGCGVELMTKKNVVREVQRLISLREKLNESLATAGFQRLAFGGVNDCVSLLQGIENGCDISGLDLFMISEIKKPKDGALEIKFFDRIKALERLREYSKRAEGSVPFYEALEKGALALGEENE